MFGSWLVNKTRKEIVFTGSEEIYKINWILNIWDKNDDILIYNQYDCAYIDNKEIYSYTQIE